MGLHHRNEQQKLHDARFTNEQRRRRGVQLYDEEYVDPMQRKPDVIANADVEYERLLMEDAKAKFG